MAQHLAQNLQSVLPDAMPKLPLDALTEYIAGGQLALINWWMEQRSPGYTAPQIATMLHELRRIAIQDAFALKSGL